ncbi:hypothetical protein BJX99DRAFT_255313 [Aspergillus californicus]
MRFVFPSAKASPKGGVSSPEQWFEAPPAAHGIFSKICSSAVIPSERQRQGLAETTRMLVALIHREAGDFNWLYDWIILRGYKEGAAAAVFTMLAKNELLVGFIGIDSRLPLEEEVPDAQRAETDILFRVGAVNHLRTVIGMNLIDTNCTPEEAREQLEHLNTPVFLECGSRQQRVSVALPHAIKNTFGMDLRREKKHWYHVLCPSQRYKPIYDFLTRKIDLPYRSGLIPTRT